MQLQNLISPDSIITGAKAESKKRALELISDTLAHKVTDSDLREILESLLHREKLGSTSIGHGVAIPHARLKAIEHPIATLAVFEHAIDWDNIDGESVQIIFAIIIPESATTEHLELLATLAELFSSEKIRKKILQETDPLVIFKEITEHNG